MQVDRATFRLELLSVPRVLRNAQPARRWYRTAGEVLYFDGELQARAPASGADEIHVAAREVQPLREVVTRHSRGVEPQRELRLALARPTATAPLHARHVERQCSRPGSLVNPKPTTSPELVAVEPRDAGPCASVGARRNAFRSSKQEISTRRRRACGCVGKPKACPSGWGQASREVTSSAGLSPAAAHPQASRTSFETRAQRGRRGRTPTARPSSEGSVVRSAAPSADPSRAIIHRSAGPSSRALVRRISRP